MEKQHVSEPGYDGWGGCYIVDDVQAASDAGPEPESDTTTAVAETEKPALPDIATMDRRELLRPETLQRFYDSCAGDKSAWYERKQDLIDRALEIGGCVRELKSTIKDIESLPARGTGTAVGGAESIPHIVGLSAVSCLTTQYRTGPEWVVEDDGVQLVDVDARRVKRVTHGPVIPIGLTTNVEDGSMRLKLLYRAVGAHPTALLSEGIFAMDQLSSIQEITALRRYGFPAHAKNAGDLIQYLDDVIALNPELISRSYSSGKLGWHERDGRRYFLPYDSGADFCYDAADSNAETAGAIEIVGDHEAWRSLILEIRKTKRTYFLMAMATTLASALIPICKVTPFIVDLSGGTGAGKTLTQYVAASQIGRYQEYVISFRATDVGLETCLDNLNNLPLIMDDSNSKKNRRTQAESRAEMEALVYMITNGHGKLRSSKNLILRRKTRWACCALTSSEQPIADMLDNGGSQNRILTVACGQGALYPKDDPGSALHPENVLKVINDNHGFAMRAFIEICKRVEDEEIVRLYKKAVIELTALRAKMGGGTAAEDKRVDSLALILTADYLMEQYYYKDGIRIGQKSALRCIGAVEDIDVNRRMYDFMVDRVGMLYNKNFYPFELDDGDHIPTGQDRWGFVQTVGDRTTLYIMGPGIRALYDGTQYRLSSTFFEWLVQQGYMGSAETMVKKIPSVGQNCRIYTIDISQREEPDDHDNQPLEAGVESDAPIEYATDTMQEWATA